MVDFRRYSTVLYGSPVLVIAPRVGPLRGGSRKHAGAGTGVLSVWQPREAVVAEHREHARRGKHALPEFPAELYLPPFLLELVGVAHPPAAT